MTECESIFRPETETCSSTVLWRDTADKPLQLKKVRGNTGARRGGEKLWRKTEEGGGSL